MRVMVTIESTGKDEYRYKNSGISVQSFFGTEKFHHPATDNEYAQDSEVNYTKNQITSK